MASTGSNSSAAAEPDAAPRRAAHADVVVALTSYNDVRTVGARRARGARGAGAILRVAAQTLLVLADARSTDGTREAARAAVGAGAICRAGAAAGRRPSASCRITAIPVAAAAMRAILQIAARLGAGACAVLDAGLENVDARVDRAAGRAGRGRRVRLRLAVLSSGASAKARITKGIVYPMFRALYGVRLRQPAAGEFGCSGRLVAHYLEQDFWDAERAEAGIDLWLAVAAVCGGFRVVRGVARAARDRRATRQPPI